MTWHNERKSWKVNARRLAKDLQVSEGTIRNVDYQQLGYIRSNVLSSEEHIMTPPFFPQELRVNPDADAYVETLQIIVKPPWMNNVANGGRLYVFQQDSASFHKASNSRNWMESLEFPSFCHTKLMAS
ncbi:hypothetical protein ACTXT7_017650 [Hymenolepis weldensis]